MRFQSIWKVAAAGIFVTWIGVGCAGCQSETPVDPVTTDDTPGEFDSGPTESGGDTMTREVPVAELDTIYFDYDRASIRDDQRPTLRQNGNVIRNSSWGTVVIEGHCDERGSEEYNLALGERRANAVKRYLVDSGVAATQVDTVTFGESRPAVAGHDESAWRNNRRAEFRVVR